jgi:hypothetical protein
MIPSHWNAQTEYASLLNNMLPFMSPEDQRTIATSLFMMYPESFVMYNPEAVSFESPTGGTLGLNVSPPSGGVDPLKPDEVLAQMGSGSATGGTGGSVDKSGSVTPMAGIVVGGPSPGGMTIPERPDISTVLNKEVGDQPSRLGGDKVFDWYGQLPPLPTDTGGGAVPTKPSEGIPLPGGGMYSPSGGGSVSPPPSLPSGLPGQIPHVPAEQGVPAPIPVYGGGGIPDQVSDQLKEQYYSSGRGTAMLDALERMRLAAGVDPEAMGPGYAYMRAVADTIRDFGGTPGQGQTRMQYEQMLGAIDPLLAQNQNENLQAFGTAARSLLQPYFSAGQLMPVQVTETGQRIYGTPQYGFF